MADAHQVTANKAVFLHVASNGLKNVVYYSGGIGLALLIAHYVRWLGIALFAIITVIVVISALQGVAGALLGIVALVGKTYGAVRGTVPRSAFSGDEYLWGSSGIQLVESTVLIGALFYGFRDLFPAGLW